MAARSSKPTKIMTGLSFGLGARRGSRVEEMGVILGVAVLLDTLLVRLLLLPAVLRLLGRAAWWTPRVLDRLPRGLRLRDG